MICWILSERISILKIMNNTYNKWSLLYWRCVNLNLHIICKLLIIYWLFFSDDDKQGEEGVEGDA